MPEVLLKIRPAKLKEDDRGPKRGPLLMEQVFAALHSLQTPIAFEIGSLNGRISFFARTDERAALLLESHLYAQYPDIDVERVEVRMLEPEAGSVVFSRSLALKNPEIFPIKRHSQFDDVLNRISVDPLSAITSTLSRFEDSTMRGHIAIAIRPVSKNFRRRALRFLPLMSRGFTSRWERYRNLFVRVHLARGWKRTLLILPDILMGGFRSRLRIGIQDFTPLPQGPISFEDPREQDVKLSATRHERENELQGAIDKLNRLLFVTTIHVSVIARKEQESKAHVKLQEIISSFKQFDLPLSNRFRSGKAHVHHALPVWKGSTMLLSNEELATIWHLPTLLVKTPSIEWVTSRKLEPPSDLPIDKEDSLSILGESFFRGRRQRFGIAPEDRLRHIYTIGKTGMGKSTLLQNMIFSDIHAGKGLALLDPHGDLADSVLRMIPRERSNDVVLFEPADRDYPISFNMLECRNVEHRPLIASGLMAVFTKLWPDVWSGRMEHILRNTLLALLESEGNSMLGIMRMYADTAFCKKVVSHVSDPLVRSFWEDEYASWSEKFRNEAVAAIQNKIGQLLSTPLIRNIIGQVSSTLDLRHAMDTGKIIIVNLSKGKLGEDNSSFLGSMLVTKFQIDALSRADIPEKERRAFYLYVDEFQNFATPSFATILSEARKYALSLTMANQYIGQLVPDKANTQLRDAVFGNVGTLISFQIGSEDAEEVALQFGDESLTLDLVSLPKYQAYMRLMINGVTSAAFSVSSLPPPSFEQDSGRIEIIRKLSRERYAEKRTVIEEKIKRWSESAKAAKEVEKKEAKTKEKELEEIKKAKKKGMKLDEYRIWRDREMWTNSLNALKKKELGGETLSKEERGEMEKLSKQLEAAGGATVEPSKRTV